MVNGLLIVYAPRLLYITAFQANSNKVSRCEPRAGAAPLKGYAILKKCDENLDDTSSEFF